MGCEFVLVNVSEFVGTVVWELPFPFMFGSTTMRDDSCDKYV
jgi:hypothetical protein